MPNGGLITETNAQYYAGAQGFVVTAPAGQNDFTFTFDTPLKFGSFDPTIPEYALNNFKLYSSPDGITYTEYILSYTVDVQPNNNTVIQLAAPLPQNNVLVCQLKTIDGGSFGSRDAYGTVSYTHLTLPTNREV